MAEEVCLNVTAYSIVWMDQTSIIATAAHKTTSGALLPVTVSRLIGHATEKRTVRTRPTKKQISVTKVRAPFISN